MILKLIQTTDIKNYHSETCLRLFEKSVPIKVDRRVGGMPSGSSHRKNHIGLKNPSPPISVYLCTQFSMLLWDLKIERLGGMYICL